MCHGPLSDYPMVGFSSYNGTTTVDHPKDGEITAGIDGGREFLVVVSVQGPNRFAQLDGVQAVGVSY